LLIENVFKHNIVTAQNPLEIDIFIDRDDRLVIRNNYQPRRKDEVVSTGIGHKNLMEKYKLLDGGDPLFMLTGNHYIACIPLLSRKP